MPPRPPAFDRECLEDVKRRHEDRFRRALAALKHAKQQYVDHTRDQIVVHCSTLQRMYGGQLHEEARLGTAESVNKIADQLRRTRAARQLLCRVLEEGGELGAAEAAARGLMDGEEIRNLDRQLELAGWRTSNPLSVTMVSTCRSASSSQTLSMATTRSSTTATSPTT